MSAVHELKTDPEAFDAVARGVKTYEMRKNDRGFKVGDVLWLRKTEFTGSQMHPGREGLPLIYTGEELRRTVSHIQTGYGLQDGWCLLSITTPPAAPAPCIGRDPLCPCKDGDTCHYVATKKTRAWVPIADEYERLKASLKDPVQVHVALMRGEIAKPPIRDMLHAYGAEALGRWDGAAPPQAEPRELTAREANALHRAMLRSVKFIDKPVAQAEPPKPVAWLIEYELQGIEIRNVHLYNSVAEYRKNDPNARAKPLYAEPVTAASEPAPMLMMAKPMPLAPESVEIMARACGVWAEFQGVAGSSAGHNAKLLDFARSVREAP